MDHYILNEVKQLCGIHEASEAFDINLILFINSTFSRLRQLHAGPPIGFRLSEDSLSTWGEYTTNEELLDLIKDYVVTKTILKFNPPANATLIEELHNQVNELEFSILNITDSEKKVGE